MCSTSSDAWKHASPILRGSWNDALSSASLIVSPRFSSAAYSTSMPRAQFGRARSSFAFSEMPSVSQRGTRELDICSVMTCPSSCHNVPSHWKSPGGRAFGESIVTTGSRSRRQESADHAGKLTLRTAKSSCFGKISMRMGPWRERYALVMAAMAVEPGDYPLNRP